MFISKLFYVIQESELNENNISKNEANPQKYLQNN